MGNVENTPRSGKKRTRKLRNAYRSEYRRFSGIYRKLCPMCGLNHASMGPNVVCIGEALVRFMPVLDKEVSP